MLLKPEPDTVCDHKKPTECHVCADGRLRCARCGCELRTDGQTGEPIPSSDLLEI